MKKILYVEDEDALRMVTESVLRAAGFLVTAAADGLEALSLHQASDFDLIVTDHRMPQMDGASLIESLKALGTNTPVIVLSAEADVPGAMNRYQELGVTNFLAKPVETKDLIATVSKLTNGHEEVS